MNRVFCFDSEDGGAAILRNVGNTRPEAQSHVAEDLNVQAVISPFPVLHKLLHFTLYPHKKKIQMT
jgi:hypothetical protein